MSHLSTKALAGIASLSTRQVQRLLAAGDVPTAYRSSGRHWVIPDSPTVRRWAAQKKQEVDLMVAPLIKRDDYWQNIKTLGKGVAAGENLASLETADRCAKDVANGHVTRAVQRLTTALSSAPDVIDRGGAWKEVEAAAKAIHLWHGLHSHKSTDSEKRHFRAIVASVSSLLD